MYYNTFSGGNFVYAYVHPVLGIIYIGITNDLIRRIHEHDAFAYDNVNKRYDARKIFNESCVYFTETSTRNEAELVEDYLVAKYHPCLNGNKKRPEFEISIMTKPWFRYKRENEFTPQKFNFDASRILGGTCGYCEYKEDFYADAYRLYIKNLESKIRKREEKIENLENLIKKMKT